MSRQLKFRAWDSMAGIMLYRTLFDRNWYSTPSNTDTGCNCIQGIKPRDCHMPTMQFTGLLDKNGVEIYEGDIVLNKDFVGNPDCVAKWEREVVWDDANAAWDGIEGETVEVIGNIHTGTTNKDIKGIGNE